MECGLKRACDTKSAEGYASLQHFFKKIFCNSAFLGNNYSLLPISD